MNEASCSSILENKSSGINSHMLGTLPPPPTKSRIMAATNAKTNNIGENELSPHHQHSLLSSSIPPPPHISSIRKKESPSSPVNDTASSHGSSMPTDKNWSFFQNKDDQFKWTNFEEHHHLLGNEDDSSERHSSDEDFDIWSITDEQQDYYVAQFKSMQPDLQKKITGATAKDFFEKSKLPLIELSKIWQLSDVDKDGALSLEEFCTAMHLVVLRRNNIELPDVLPSSLVPRIPKKTEPINIPCEIQNPPQDISTASPKKISPSELASPQSKEWTKFNESPTSSLSSPGMKPVNFDFSAASVEQDPKILHPVAVRLSPERQNVSYNALSDKEQLVTDELKSNQTQSHITQRPKARKPLGLSLSNAMSSMASEYCVDAIKESSSSFSGTSDSSKVVAATIPSQTSSSLPQGPKKEPPPPPPPRPKHNHIRSSSLDLNKLGKTVPNFLGAPPAVPPRVSPSTATAHKSLPHSDEQQINDSANFADFTNFEDPDGANVNIKSGAFEIYKKPVSLNEASLASSSESRTLLLEQIPTPSAAIDDSTALLMDSSQLDESLTLERKRHTSAPPPPLALTAANIQDIPGDKRELQAAIRAHRERNMMLTLLNTELNQELSEVMEERIALEIQLEHLKSFT